MTFALLLPLLREFAPEAVQVIGYVVANIAAGRSQHTVSDADYTEIDRLAANTSEVIYKRLGITPPPPTS